MTRRGFVLAVLLVLLSSPIELLGESPVSWDPPNPKVGQPITFTYNGDHTAVEWCFNNEKECTAKSGGQATKTHTYKESGTYIVRVLEVTDVSSKWWSVSVKVTD